MVWASGRADDPRTRTAERAMQMRLGLWRARGTIVTIQDADLEQIRRS
jgi:hypothetical protein